MHPKGHETLSIREDVLTILRTMEPYAERLGGVAALEPFYHVAHAGSDAHYLRQEYTATGSAEGMVNAAIHRFREGCVTAGR